MQNFVVLRFVLKQSLRAWILSFIKITTVWNKRLKEKDKNKDKNKNKNIKRKKLRNEQK